MSVHLARGTRDILPDAAARRHHVLDQLRTVFSRHGFEPLETPAIERIETLLGKYGDEGSKLMFKILKRGKGAERGECDLALRYDLTVPLARVIAMNPQLRLPFKRWQAAPVWRAERPARGRYREFWQCDADIVGSTEPLAEAQLVALACDALTTLGFSSFALRVNDRRILRALARTAGAEGEERETSLLVAVDKLDKIGRAGVDAELTERGFAEEARQAMWEVLELSGSNDERLAALEAALPGEEVAAAVADLRQVLALSVAMGAAPDALRIDPTLARGLDYYTGPVFEIVVEEPDIGSLGGGGRYDGLVGVFGKQSVPAVGMALGLERILIVMEELDMFGPLQSPLDVMVLVADRSAVGHAAQTAAALRKAGLRTDLYTGSGSLKSQFKYANAKSAPWVAILGADEAQQGTVTLKHMDSGEQTTCALAEAARTVMRDDG